MDRSLTIGATGGTVGALALRLLADLFGASAPPALPYPLDCPLCPLLPEPTFGFLVLDPFSVLVGIGLGLLIGPLLDFCYIVRQSWRLWVRDRLAVLARQTSGSYRIL